MAKPPQIRTFRLEQATIRRTRAIIARITAQVGPLMDRLDFVFKERAMELRNVPTFQVRDSAAESAETVLESFRSDLEAQTQAGTLIAAYMPFAEAQARAIYKQSEAQLAHFGVRVAREPRLREYAAMTSRAHAKLIRNVSTQVSDKVSRIVQDALLAGTHASEVRKQLKAELGDEFNAKRARLIARDQLGTLQSIVQHETFRAAGVTKAIWRTAKDARVRPEHEEREGEEYDIDKGIDGELPGTPINCRCYAEPVVD